MAFLLTNNSTGFFLHSKINCPGNYQGTLHRASSGSKTKSTSLQFFSDINRFLFKINSFFEGKQSFFKTGSKPINVEDLRNQFSYLERLQMFIKMKTYALPIVNRSVEPSLQLLLSNKSDLQTALNMATKRVSMSRKSEHLFNQVRYFKAENNFKGIKEVPGFWRRLKLFCYEEAKPNSREELENFLTKLKSENINAEQTLREAKAYFEGHLVAHESLSASQKYSWRSFVITSLAVVGGIYLLLKSGWIDLSSEVNSVDIKSVSNMKFSDVKGADEAKQELQNVVEFLKNPEKFASIGAKLPKGVLLVGPPGTGKTLLAKAVAGEAGVTFFSSTGSEFDEVFVGVGARRIRDLFKEAKDVAPCVIFIDEIDSIGKTRTSSSLHPHANDTINQLLSEMDGFKNVSGIVVLGATNRKDDLDKALLRPGRFDVEVAVSLPDYKGRKELFEFYVSKIRHENIDIEKLARGTAGFTGADIENMVNQAALKATLTEAVFVKMEHMEYARDKAIMGPESISRITDEETNRITAYHESGHTVVAYFTKHSNPLHKVTIIARGPALGHTSYIPDKDNYHYTKTQMIAALDVMMGGRAAEEMVLGSENVTSGASSDLVKATRLATKMVSAWGMSDSVGLTTYDDYSQISPETANLIDLEVKKILQESYERAKNILIKHQKQHKELSEALLKYETLDAEEIATIMKGESLFKSI